MSVWLTWVKAALLLSYRDAAHCSGLGVYLSPVFCLLALQASANSIRRRIASEREGLSFRCFARLSISDLSAGCESASNLDSDAILVTDQLAESVFVESINSIVYRQGIPLASSALSRRGCAFRRSRPGIPSEGGRLYRLKPAGDSDDPGHLPRRALVSTSSSGQLVSSASSL